MHSVLMALTAPGFRLHHADLVPMFKYTSDSMHNNNPGRPPTNIRACSFINDTLRGQLTLG